MKKSIHILEDISNQCSSHMTYYKFNKMEEHLSEKYRKGRIDAAKYLSDLTYYFFQEEKSFLIKYLDYVNEQKKRIDILKDDEYKQGLYDQLNIIESMINSNLSK